MASARGYGLRFKLDIEPIRIPSAYASPVALLVSELIMLAFHRGGQGPATIAITLKRHRDSHYCLIVEDRRPANGRADQAMLERARSFIKLFSRQLQAQVEADAPSEQGLRIAVELPASEPKPGE